MTNVSEVVAASLTRYNMLSPDDRVGVAVSGGADSVTLLHVLHGHVAAGAARYQIVVLHVNHQLRGAESDQDEEFVRALAAELGLPVEVKCGPIGAGNMEQQARQVRRDFFSEARERLKLNRVALGHNQSDQAETVLYRFLRGSGLAGLAGMSAVTTDGLIRPMLDLTREEIRSWASDRGISWREDASNLNTELIRNRLRLEFFNPRLVQVLSANAVVARDEEAWWRKRIEELFHRLVKETRLGFEFSVAALQPLEPAERRRLLRRAVQQVKGDLRSIDLCHIERVQSLLGSEAGHDRVLIPGADIIRSFGTLLLAVPGRFGKEARHYRMFTEIGKEVALPYDGGRLYVNWIKRENQFCGNFGVEPGSDREVVDLDGDLLAGVGRLDGLCIRNWEPGDEYCRASHEKPEKIKSLFQEHRVVLWARRRWPVMILNEEIVWSRHFGPAARFQAQPESRSILRVQYVSESGSDRS